MLAFYHNSTNRLTVATSIFTVYFYWWASFISYYITCMLNFIAKASYCCIIHFYLERSSVSAYLSVAWAEKYSEELHAPRKDRKLSSLHVAIRRFNVRGHTEPRRLSIVYCNEYIFAQITCCVNSISASSSMPVPANDDLGRARSRGVIKVIWAAEPSVGWE